MTGNSSSMTLNPTRVQTSVTPSVPQNPFPTTATYVVPHTNVMVKVIKAPGAHQPIDPMAFLNLIETGKVAVDLLAARAGGATADLDVPRIRWAISGLAIQTTDATRISAGGGRFRFDELKAVYTGLLVAVGRIGDLECVFYVWRVSPIISRRVKFLGYGTLQHATMENGEWTNATADVA
ncbi:MAG: hypothetical protein LQ338_007368 [Usnochroma carphineum]|nr:MAG: hypothetical protein LQ338_007368 [Usnochroma carphineum]